MNDANLHGVALAAIQGLNQKLEEKEARHRDLEVEIENPKRKTVRMVELERRLLAMKNLLNQQTTMVTGGE